ncbi:EamA family transporter [Microbacterium sp. KNMS]
MLALRRMTHTAFGTLLSIEPAFGILIGLLLLGQNPTPLQVVGIILVVTSGAAAQRDGARVVDPSAGEPAPTRTDTQ